MLKFMLKRPLFWLGLLLGSFTAFQSVHRTPLNPAAAPAGLLLDLTGEAVIACGSDGAILFSNAAARTFFGPPASHLPELRYPSGQRVPPGQLPWNRARSRRQSLSGAEYHGTTADGADCIFAISAYPLPGGGAAAVFRNVTAPHEHQASLNRMQRRQTALSNLGRRLSAAVTLEATSRAIVEETVAVLSLLGVQVRLYGYNPALQILTRLASEPEHRPKRPPFAVQARPPMFPFVAGVPALWQLYIARKPTSDHLSALGEAEAASMCAMPLVAGSVAVGHLSVSSSAHDAFDDPAVQEAMDIMASAAALALAGWQSMQTTAHLVQQQDAVREVALAVAGASVPGSLADTAAKLIKHIIGGICTVSIASENGLQAAGTAYQDDLLFPERTQWNSSALHGKAVQKAWRTQKIVTQLGIVNPGYEKAVWRAFAEVGCHCVIALPLASRLGVLAVTVEGASPLPDMQMKFLTTIAALLSSGLKPATAKEAPANS